SAMTEDKRRLKRLRLIERVRSVEQRQAADAAHQAQAVRQRLEQLSEKTRSLAQLYALRDHAGDAAELRSAAVMGVQLRQLGRTADAQAGQARAEAESRMRDLASAERRRQRAEDQRRDAHRALLERLLRPENTPVRKVGTVVE
ncbi:MAG: hypothetical protein WA842_05280, partial [Croceibacterium sp.]